MKICGCSACSTREREVARQEKLDAAVRCNEDFLILMHSTFTAAEEWNMKLLVERSGVTVADVLDELRASATDAEWAAVNENPYNWEEYD